MKTKPNNYELTFGRAEKEFLRFDQEEILRAGHLKADDEYIYVTFFYALYRIDRRSGRMEKQMSDGGYRHAAYNEGMGIFDAICEPTPFRRLCGEMVDMNYFTNTSFNGRSMFQPYADRFAANLEKFRKVCLEIGGRPQKESDAGFAFDLFDFLPMTLLLWEGEEGIPAAIRFLWDRNTTDFIRFETMFIVITHVLETLSAAMGFETEYKALSDGGE
ncbi:MAG: DUF3786 domain-containing protein [Clostridia bacterium]